MIPTVVLARVGLARVGLVLGLGLMLGCGEQAPPPAPTPAPLPPLPKLLSAAQLRARQDAGGVVQLIDTRSQAAFDAGRIPGSLSLPVEMLELDSGAELASSTRARVSALLSAAGVAKHGDLVAIDDATPEGFGRAAYFCWTVALTGYERCVILLGGWERWKREGHGWDASQAHSRPPPGSLDPIGEALPMLARLNDLRRATAAADPAIVDVRSLADGPGIPGAIPFPLGSYFLPDALIDTARLDAAAARAGLFGEKQLISFGRGPYDASAGWYLLRQVLGITQVALYPEGLEGWRQHSMLPGNPDPEPAAVATPAAP